MSAVKLESYFVQFKLEYPETKLEIGDRHSSDTFSFRGHLFRIDCYPLGYYMEPDSSGEYVWLYLELLNRSTNKVKVNFEASLVDRDGQPDHSYTKELSETIVSQDSFWEWGDEAPSYWGWDDFVARSDLESFASNGWVTIRCGVIVIEEDEPLKVPPSDIGSHLGQLLQSTEGSDVSFVVNGETFPCHRAVLAARSPVFKAQLLGSMADAKMSSITLHDVPAAAFKVMIGFMYTDALPAGDDDELTDASSADELFQDLLALADRYALDRLKLLCANKLWNNMSVDTFAAILSSAETYNCPELKKKCIKFFEEEKNFKKIVLTEGYVELMHKFPSILAELRKKVDVE